MIKNIKRVIAVGFVGIIAMSSCSAYNCNEIDKAKAELDSISVSIKEQINVKNSAHLIATHAREIGDGSIEEMAQEHWIEANKLHIDLVEKQNELNSTIKNIEAKYRFLGEFKITHYADVPQSQGRWTGQTASGVKPTVGRTIAVDPKVIPLGSTVYIAGYGTFVGEDTGGAIKGNKIDVLVSDYPTALDMGVKYANVYVIDD